MLKINYAYLNRFIKTYNNYLYPIMKGVYISFDRNTLEYTGMQMFYNSSYYPLSKCEDTLSKLLSLGYVEIYSD